ncbi:MAG: hypothetical protein RLZZ450_4583 [Pseudomonadota bacterium]|jgi:hypothetical protein
MKRLWLVLAVAIVGGCAPEANDPQDEGVDRAEPEALGGLSLSLTSGDSRGRTYRLRNATFSIANDYWYYDGGVPQTTVLSTEDDPTADQLTVRLVPNSYRVTLGGDWYIERLTANGAERIQQVVLLNGDSQYAYVNQDWNTEIHFQFGVDGTLIDFRHGDLNIDIDIELPGDHSADGGTPFPRLDAGFPIRRDSGAPIIID